MTASIDAEVYIHPTATQSPAAIRRIEKSSGRKAVIVDGQPMLVRDGDNATMKPLHDRDTENAPPPESA